MFLEDEFAVLISLIHSVQLKTTYQKMYHELFKHEHATGYEKKGLIRGLIGQELIAQNKLQKSYQYFTID